MTQPLFMNRYQVEHPDWIQLFSLATPNGRKVSIALEELELPYESHLVDIRSGDQFSDEFISVNPNSKIPAIWDPEGPGRKPIHMMESGAILLYLAEKTGKLIPEDPVLRNETFQWLFFQMAGVGPMFGQFGHFYKYAAETCEHPYPKERYTNETRRLLGVLDKRLGDRKYLVGDQYSIADIATFPWIGCLNWGYDAVDHLKLSEFEHVNRWHTLCDERPASQRGNKVCAIG